jgi:hypothetical protein
MIKPSSSAVLLQGYDPLVVIWYETEIQRRSGSDYERNSPYTYVNQASVFQRIAWVLHWPGSLQISCWTFFFETDSKSKETTILFRWWQMVEINYEYLAPIKKSESLPAWIANRNKWKPRMCWQRWWPAWVEPGLGEMLNKKKQQGMLSSCSSLLQVPVPLRMPTTLSRIQYSSSLPLWKQQILYCCPLMSHTASSYPRRQPYS